MLQLNDYLYQDIYFPANALLRVSAWAQTSGDNARLQILSSDRSTSFALTDMNSASPARLEFYLTPSQRAGATTAKLALRNFGTTGIASFCDIEIEDMTN